MTLLSLFLLCGLVPLLLTVVGAGLCVRDIRKEHRSREAGEVPLPGHILAAQLLFERLVPAGVAWLGWVGGGTLLWLASALKSTSA